MRLVTIRPKTGVEVAASDYQAAILLQGGRILTIGALVEIAPSELPSEFGRATLAELFELDPGVGQIRAALELASAAAIKAVSIVTGTPSGVGVFREPPVFLEPGDLVRVEVERIGSLTSPVADADGRVPDGSPAARFLAEVAG